MSVRHTVALGYMFLWPKANGCYSLFRMVPHAFRTEKYDIYDYGYAQYLYCK